MNYTDILLGPNQSLNPKLNYTDILQEERMPIQY